MGPVGRKGQFGRLWRPRAGPNSWESRAAKGHKRLEAPWGAGVSGWEPSRSLGHPVFRLRKSLPPHLLPFTHVRTPDVLTEGITRRRSTPQDWADPASLRPKGRQFPWTSPAPRSSCDSPAPGSPSEALLKLLFHYIYLIAKLQNAKRCHSPWGKYFSLFPRMSAQKLTSNPTD